MKKTVVEFLHCVEQALNWDLYPETVVSWMKLYIQMASVYDFTNLLVPQFSQETYIQITQVYTQVILTTVPAIQVNPTHLYTHGGLEKLWMTLADVL